MFKNCCKVEWFEYSTFTASLFQFTFVFQCFPVQYFYSHLIAVLCFIFLQNSPGYSLSVHFKVHGFSLLTDIISGFIALLLCFS